MANEFKIRKGLIVEGASGGTVVDVQGSQGQLFSVTDNLSGSIFAVSDISGVPILDINSSGISYFDGSVGIGIDNPNSKLHVLDGVAGTYTPDSESDTLVIESDTPGGISLIGTGSGSNSKQSIVFGTTSDVTSARIIYNSNNSVFSIGTTTASNYLKLLSGNGATALTLDASQNAIFTGDVGIDATLPLAKLQVGLSTSNTGDRSALAMFGAAESGILNALSLVNTTGAAATGYGTRINFHLSSNYSPTGCIEVVTEDLTSNATDSTMRFSTYGTLSGVTTYQSRLEISSAGAIKFNDYDSTKQTGTPTYILGTDASGNVVKVLGSDVPGSVSGSGTLRTIPMWTPDGDTLGNSVLTQDAANQNIGLGVTPETGMVTYISQLRIGEQSALQGHTNGVGVDSATYLSTNYKFGTSGAVFINGTVATPGYAAIYQQQVGEHTFSCSTASGVADAAITSRMQMVIKQTGSVGIGTTTPGTLHSASYGTTKLHIDGGTDRGQMILEGDNLAGIIFSDNGHTVDQRVFSTIVDGGDYQIKPLNDNGTSTAQGAAVTVLHGGNVGIGTTSPGGIFEVFQQSTGRTRGDLLVDAGAKYVYVGRLSTTSGDVSSFKVRDRLNRAYFDVNTASKYISFNPEIGDITMQIASGYGFKVNGGQFNVNATSGNVGIGDTTNNAKLGVSGGAVKIKNIVSSSPQGQVRKNINIASFDQGGVTATGKLIIETPVMTTGAMGKFKISGWQYDESWDLTVSGYLRIGTNRGWQQIGGAILTGNPPFNIDEVRLCYNHTTDIFYIILGTTTTFWDYYTSIVIDADSIYQDSLPTTGWDMEVTTSDPSGLTSDITLTNIAEYGSSNVIIPGSVAIGSYGPHNGRLNVQDGDAEMKFSSASSARPWLVLKHNIAPSNGDEIGLQDFNAFNDADEDTRYAIWSAKAEDVTDGTEDGSLTLMTMDGGTLTNTLTGRSGKVGVNQVNPAQALDVTGKIRVTDDIILAQQNGRIDYDNGFTTGALRFWSTSGNAERMRISAAGNVGIGATNPGKKLEVAGSYKLGTNAYIEYGGVYPYTITTANTASVGNLVFSAGLGSAAYESKIDLQGTNAAGVAGITLSTASTARMVVTADGDVGIGTSTPNAKLDVQGTQGQLFSVTDDLSGDIFSVADISGVPIMNVNSDGTSYFDGDVGIGVNNPSYKLDVWGNGIALGSAAFSKYDSSNDLFLVGDWDGAGADMAIYDGNSNEVVRVASGNVGIGTDSPGARLDVGGDLQISNNKTNATNKTNRIKAQHYTNAEEPVTFMFLNSFSTTNTMFIGGGSTIENAVTSMGFYTGGTNTTTQGSLAMIIDNSQNVGIGNTGPSYKLDVSGTIRATGDVIAYSDERVKENIQTIDNSLEKVIKLRGVEFNKIGEDVKSIGVIAQEIEKVIPEVVREDEKGMKSVAYGNITGILIEAIKELKQEVEQLKKQIKNGNNL